MEDKETQGVGRSLVVDAAGHGQRLDRALEALMPGSGLRLRRRLIELGRVLVQGRPAQPGLKLREGWLIELLPDAAGHPATPSLRIIAQDGHYAAVLKPAGLHSAAIAGLHEPSAEAQLPVLFPQDAPVLLNRLDNLTSGLLLLAVSDSARQDYTALDPLVVDKEYVAVVVGDLDEPLELKRVLDADDRRRTRVLGKLDPLRRNWTLVWPEAGLGGGLTRVRVLIHAGARHQIRAHLAAAGLPILGDPLYGEGNAEAPRLYLHHRRIAFPGFEAVAPEDWPEPTGS